MILFIHFHSEREAVLRSQLNLLTSLFVRHHANVLVKIPILWQYVVEKHNWEPPCQKQSYRDHWCAERNMVLNCPNCQVICDFDISKICIWCVLMWMFSPKWYNFLLSSLDDKSWGMFLQFQCSLSLSLSHSLSLSLSLSLYLSLSLSSFSLFSLTAYLLLLDRTFLLSQLFT